MNEWNDKQSQRYHDAFISVCYDNIPSSIIATSKVNKLVNNNNDSSNLF